MDLHTFLKKKKISQQKFADNLGITQTHVSRICLNIHTPSTLLAIKIIEFSEGRVTLDDLLSTKDRKDIQDWRESWKLK